MKNVSNNRFFKAARQQATRLLGNKEKLNQTLKVASEKFKDVRTKGLKNTTLVEKLKVISRLVKAYVRGEYRQIRTANIILLVAAIVYFITPIDLIPDFVPITGFMDDFTVIMWVYGQLQAEIEAFEMWENKKETAGYE